MNNIIISSITKYLDYARYIYLIINNFSKKFITIIIFNKLNLFILKSLDSYYKLTKTSNYKIKRFYIDENNNYKVYNFYNYYYYLGII